MCFLLSPSIYWALTYIPRTVLYPNDIVVTKAEKIQVHGTHILVGKTYDWHNCTLLRMWAILGGKQSKE
jgi:hypothetical protein